MSLDETQPPPTDIAAGPPPHGTPKRAFCPNCGATVEAKIPVCPHCKYDFLLRKTGRGPAFSTLADLVLIVAAALALFGSVGAIGVAGFAVGAGQFGAAVISVAAAIVLLGAAITFLRVQRLEPPP